MAKSIRYCRGMLIAASLLPCFSFAATNSEIEVIQAQATLLYHSGQYEKCQKSLREILAKDGKQAAALEMLALTQKKLSEDSAAALTYEQLIKLGNKQKLPAYHFELATIRYKQKKFEDAKKHFSIAATGQFNAGTSHFFIGVMDFQAKNYRAARNHLTASLTYSDGQPMAPVSRYYLASSYAQMGKSDAAIVNYHEAETGVEEREKTPSKGGDNAGSMLGDIRKSALKELKSYDKNQRQLSVSLMSQWDSNVQTNPSEVENKDAQSSQRSLKTVISASASYVTSPTQKIQIIPSYSLYTNYNLHYLARDFNFITHSPSLYAMYKPYSRLSYGFKVAGTFSMKNNLALDDSKSKLKYRPFSLVGDLGPVVKYELTPRINLVFEAYFRPKKYYLDPASGDSRRSGEGLASKLSADFISGFDWLAPTIYGSYEWDYPNGRTFRVYTYGAGISNSFQLNDRFAMTPFIDLLVSDYYEVKIPKRNDTMVSLRLAGTYVINTNWTGVADIGYTDNQSTISTSFKYNRFVVTGGASYNF